MCITIDRETGGNTIIYSRKGGVNIEMFLKNPEEIHSIKIAPGSLLTHHARTIVYGLGLFNCKKKHKKIFFQVKHLLNLMLPFEVNPFAVTKDGEVLVLDCKASFDDNALYRRRGVAERKMITNMIHLNWKLPGMISTMLSLTET